MLHDTPLNTKAGLFGLNFKYDSDIRIAEGLLMVHEDFLSVGDIYPVSKVLSPAF